MSPLNKYSWLAALGLGGYQAAQVYKDYQNAGSQTDSTVVIPYQIGQAPTETAPTDTAKVDTTDTNIYYDQYDPRFFGGY